MQKLLSNETVQQAIQKGPTATELIINDPINQWTEVRSVKIHARRIFVNRETFVWKWLQKNPLEDSNINYITEWPYVPKARDAGEEDWVREWLDYVT